MITRNQRDSVIGRDFDRPPLRLLVTDRPGEGTRGRAPNRPPGVVRLTRPGDRRQVGRLPLRRLRNGQQVCRQAGWDGPHQFVVRNQTPLDAVVAIVDPLSLRTVHVAAYVESAHSAVIAGIPSGTYEVVFDLGEAWDGTAFAAKGQRAQFVDVLRFTVTKNRPGSDPCGYEAVLHANPAGAAERRQTAEESSLAP